MEDRYVGLVFHRLTILRKSPERGGRYYEYVCQCGTKKVASIYDIKRGFVKSCGCLSREASRINGKRPKRVEDISGRRFGMLTVLYRVENDKHGCTVWMCRCDCGNEKKVSRNHLITGNTASCGCAYRNRIPVRPEDRRKWSTEYTKRRYRTEVKFALNRRIVSLMHSSLKLRGAEKTRRWKDLIGYSIDDLEKRLKRTMPKGYTWQDFLDGELHIDHIVPLSAFNYQTEEDLDFKRAWALSNLRLLPAFENVSKGDRLDTPFQPSLAF